MNHRERLIAFTIVFTAAACERAALPTAAVDRAGPLFASVSVGHFKSFHAPTDNSDPLQITLGSDGNMWFTESNIAVSQIGRIDPSGKITEFGGVTGSPDRITLGPDGNLWFTEPFPFDSRIGRITPAGVITEFQLADRAQPRDIVAGPDGNLWFTEYGAGQLAQITPAGVVTEVESVKGGPWGIGRGLDGTIRITQAERNRPGRFTLAPKGGPLRN